MRTPAGAIPYFDGHCDTVSRSARQGGSLARNDGQLDLVRLGRFRQAAQFFALFANASRFPAGALWDECRRQYDFFRGEMEKNAGLAVCCRTAADVAAAAASGRTAALLSIEGGELVDCDPDKLELVEAWGVRLVNITWNHTNALSGTNEEDTERGLTAQGRDFVRQLYRLNILPDVSHLSDAGFWDLAKMELGPMVASHSNARAVCGHSRNLTDDMFRAIRDSGGVAGLNMYTEFIGGDYSLDDGLRHIERLLALDGAKTLALGGDWDGCELSFGWQGVQDLPALWDALAARGYGRELLEDIFWGNWLRVMG